MKYAFLFSISAAAAAVPVVLAGADRDTGCTTSGPVFTIERASLDSSGNEIPGVSPCAVNNKHPGISSDGVLVAWITDAVDVDSSNPYSGPKKQLYVRALDGLLPATTMVSAPAAGVGSDPNGASNWPRFAADGGGCHWLVFTSNSPKLTEEDWDELNDPVFPRNYNDVFLRRVCTDGSPLGAPVRLSETASGVGGNGDAYGRPSISPNGRFVAFTSEASNLGGLSGNPQAWTHLALVGSNPVRTRNVWLLDRGALLSDPLDDSWYRVSKPPGAADTWEADGDSCHPSVNDAGNVAFTSYSTGLVGADPAPGDSQVYLWELPVPPATMPSLIRISAVDDVDTPSESQSGRPSLSALAGSDQYVVFETTASDLSVVNLAGGDQNGRSDIYLALIEDGVLQDQAFRVLSLDDGGCPLDVNSRDPWITPNAQYVAYNRTEGDFGREVYVVERVSLDQMRVSLTPGGADPCGWSGGPLPITPDAQWTVMMSTAADYDMTPPDTNCTTLTSCQPPAGGCVLSDLCDEGRDIFRVDLGSSLPAPR